MKRFQLAGCMAAVAASLLACERTVTTVEETSQPATCFNCHSDEDTKLVAAEQQYEFSVHASGLHVTEPNDPCSGCHTSEGFIQRIETGVIPTGLENPTAIHCFTCHAPHTTGTLERRLDHPFPLANGVIFDHHNGNACTACHQSRRDVNVYVKPASGRVTLTSRWGPHHGPQTDILTGTNGYEYPGFTYEQTNHKLATEDACLDCHMKVTENLRVGGHSFNMRFDDGEEELINVGACATCHGDLDDFDYQGVQTEIDSLVADLRGALVTAGLVTASTGLPRSTVTSSDSAGAVWNYMMAIEDRSKGVHNRKYLRGLLTSGLQYIQGTLPTPANVSARRENGGEGSK
ncbi:MAG TPA: hypothetical protein VFU38_08600 [Candidatus Krumholzibacteria bacterium]|nr:hypothetical protein [Candidatus Krumholzibacteria bacterium]